MIDPIDEQIHKYRRDSWRNRRDDGWELFSQDLESLVTSSEILLSDASPPDSYGVYAFVFENVIHYVGEAKGSGGLYDRIIKKHISGDDSHALQRQFKSRYPDRSERRKFILSNISVKWVVIDDPDRVSVVERLAIWLFEPQWNIA